MTQADTTHSDPALETLAWFLQVECQSLGFCRELLHTVDQLLDQTRRHWVWSGNAHTVYASREGATICTDSGLAPPTTVTLQELRSALCEWIERIEAELSAEA